MCAKTCGGYLTVYVALTLGIILSLCLALIEGVRSNAIQMQAICVSDIATDSVLAEYHRELFLQYNLFFVDTSYGTPYASAVNTKNRLQYYLDKNVDYDDVQQMDFLYKDFLAISFENLELEGAHLATDAAGEVFQRSAIKAMKEEYGIAAVEEILSFLSKAMDSGYLEEDLEKKRQQVSEEIESYRQMVFYKAEENAMTPEIQNPMEMIGNMQATGILSMCLPDRELSASAINPSVLISHRKEVPSDVRIGSYLSQGELTIFEKVLLREYFLRYAGNYTKEKPESFLKYQVEYVVAGKNSDQENLSMVIRSMLGIREAANVAHIYSCEEKKMAAKALGTVLSAALMIPEAAEVFSAGVVLAWGFMESVHDVKVLTSGGRIPFCKTDENWHTDIDSIWTGLEGDISEELGESYEDYLRLLLYLQDSEELTYRFMDLCEMDIRLTPGNALFRMDACANYFLVSVDVVSRYGYQYEMNREVSYK